MKQNRISVLLTSAITLGASAALIIYPRDISAAVRDSLTLCADTLLPNLFPFFVLTSLVIKLELLRPLEQALAPLMRRVFHLPGVCATALVLGAIGGYPTGARSTVELYQKGLCSRQEAEGLLSFCNNCGPAFLFGVVGCSIFGHPKYGFLLFFVHMTAALFSGAVLNRFRPVPLPCQTPKNSKPTPLSTAFVDSVTGSLGTLLNLCSFILCFGAIAKLLSITGITARAAPCLFPFLDTETGSHFLLGLLEMTHGVTAPSKAPISMQLILSAALLGWGGVSVHCQVLSLLRDTDLSVTPYLKGKALHAALSALFMWGLLYRAELTCLAIGGTLLFLPCKGAKKRSGKSAQSIV